MSEGLLWVLCGYLLGSIPVGLLLARWLSAVDVREVGSGNIGATNVARAVGKWAGAATLVLDALKGAVPTAVAAWRTGDPTWTGLVGLAAIVGHDFPLFLGFRGGKGVATGLGVFLVFAPLPALLAAAVFGGVAVTTRTVSLGSIAGALSVSLWMAVFAAYRDPAYLIPALLAGLLTVVRHRENLRRLRAGAEHRW